MAAAVEVVEVVGEATMIAAVMTITATTTRTAVDEEVTRMAVEAATGITTAEVVTAAAKLAATHRHPPTLCLHSPVATSLLYPARTSYLLRPQVGSLPPA